MRLSFWFRKHHSHCICHCKIVASEIPSSPFTTHNGIAVQANRAFLWQLSTGGLPFHRPQWRKKLINKENMQDTRHSGCCCCCMQEKSTALVDVGLGATYLHTRTLRLAPWGCFFYFLCCHHPHSGLHFHLVFVVYFSSFVCLTVCPSVYSTIRDQQKRTYVEWKSLF